MEAEHWHSRWEEGRIGFHTGKPNPWLERFYSTLKLNPGDSVLLPLCGKAVDLVWLAERGHPVTGIELSKIALEQFFEEQALESTSTTTPPFTTWKSGAITLLEGDFFDLQPETIEGCHTLFDRAALVALPEAMRRQYVAHLETLLPSGSRILLVVTDYPQEEKTPPPFAVSDEEVQQLYGKQFSIERLHSENLSASQDPLSQRGVTSLVENIYLITKQ